LRLADGWEAGCSPGARNARNGYRFGLRDNGAPSFQITIGEERLLFQQRQACQCTLPVIGCGTRSAFPFPPYRFQSDSRR
jgi:hypothetical protein